MLVNVCFYRKNINLAELVENVEGCNDFAYRATVTEYIGLDTAEFTAFCDDFLGYEASWLEASQTRLDFHNSSRCRVLQVSERGTNRVVYVATEGYDYARYVGLAV